VTAEHTLPCTAEEALARMKLVGAVYELESGRVRFLE